MHFRHEEMVTYKPDWAEAMERLTAWWQNKPIDRVPACIIAPRVPPAPRIAQRWAHPLARWQNLDLGGKIAAHATRCDPDMFIEVFLHNFEYNIERCFFGGEALPIHFVYAGPMFEAVYFGCTPHFDENTTWYAPILTDWSDLKKIEFKADHPWRCFMRKFMQRSVERSAGRWLVTDPCNVSALVDLFCLLLGNEPLLMAMVEHPDKIKSALYRLFPLVRETYDEGMALLAPYQRGSVDWMRVWAPGRVGTNQCDMSVMISPKMFHDFAIPELTDFYDHVDYGIYHLDGPEQIRHLDLLLQIEKLHLIQWVPGERINNPQHQDLMNWLDLFRRIQAAGKKVLIACPPERVRPLLNAISRRQVLLWVTCKEEKQAHEILQELDQIGV